jgi:lipoprotein NlpI
VSEEDYNGYVKEFRDFIISHRTMEWIRVISRYYLGMDQSTEEDILALARKRVIVSSRDKKEEMLCEVYYYFGEKRLLVGDRKGAEKFLRKCIETNIHDCSAYRNAKTVLQWMAEGKL